MNGDIESRGIGLMVRQGTDGRTDDPNMQAFTPPIIASFFIFTWL